MPREATGLIETKPTIQLNQEQSSSSMFAAFVELTHVFVSCEFVDMLDKRCTLVFSYMLINEYCLHVL